MSRMIFDNDCPGCRPAAIDVQTGQPMGDDHPVMRALNAAWEGASYAERQAFHRFTCLNSMEPVDLLMVQALQRRTKEEFDRQQSRPH
jgi:hypothetical protein